MNTFHVAPSVAAIALAGLAACNGANAPEPFPQAVADAWLGSFNGGDVAGLVLMYSADAEILPPDEPVISGPEAIEAFWQAYSPGQVRIELGDSGLAEDRRVLVPRGGVYRDLSRRRRAPRRKVHRAVEAGEWQLADISADVEPQRPTPA